VTALATTTDSATEHKITLGAKIKSADKGQALVRFSTPDGRTPDRDRDITDPDAFPEGAQVVISPFGHRSVTEGAIPAGRGMVHRDGTADLHFFLETRTGRETFDTLKGLGLIAQYSYGFRVLEEGRLTPEMRAAGARRYLKRIQPIELSPVVEAAGLNTGTLALKACGCGAGSTCGCGEAHPSRNEIEAAVAEGCRLFARNAKLAPTQSPLPWDQQLALDRAIRECETREQAFKANRPVEISREVPAYLAVGGSDMLYKALEAASNDLGLPELRMRFFVEPVGLRGLFSSVFPDTIWLRAGRFEWDMLETVGHEAWHARQCLHGGPPHDEAGARRYGAKLRASDPRGWNHGLVRPRLYTEQGERL
jgi:hypothetical protein